ncbi:MAG: dTMP kinase [Candidatus Peregrinibacteria bacterium]
MFIAFEGLDGSGSSTHARALAEKLEHKGHATLVTKEPTGDTPTGKLIRQVLQHKWEVSPKGLQLLFYADRAEHLKNTIEPALKNGQIVITDRYFFSSIAYGALSVDMTWLKAISSQFPLPDLTFLLKLDPETCLKRILDRGTEFELFEHHEKLTKIWANYEKIASEFQNIHVIDTTGEIEEVDEAIWKLVEERL